MGTTFIGSRLRELRKLRGMAQQGDLAKRLEVGQPVVSKWELSTGEPSLTQLREIATVLECTSDFLIGIGPYQNIDSSDPVALRDAASEMSFDIFVADLSVNPEWRERCRRVVGHPAAPVTVKAWRDLAEQIDRAVPGGNGTHMKRVR